MSRKFFVLLIFGAIAAASPLAMPQASTPPHDPNCKAPDCYTVSSVDKAPVNTKRNFPELTAAAKAAHFHSMVPACLWVSEKGQPSHVQIISPAGYGLDELALNSIEQWKFSPGLKDGKPVTVGDVCVYVSFSSDPNSVTNPPEKKSVIEASCDAPECYKVDAADKRPEPIYMPQPKYPTVEKIAHKDGVVRACMWITNKGLPVHISIVETPGPHFDEEALKSLTDWRFRPALKNGQPVTVSNYCVNVYFTFR